MVDRGRSAQIAQIAGRGGEGLVTPAANTGSPGGAARLAFQHDVQTLRKVPQNHAARKER